MDDAVLDGQILFDELGRESIIRQNSAHLCRRQKNVLGALGCEESLDCRLVRQIQLGVGTSDDIGVARGMQATHDC